MNKPATKYHPGPRPLSIIRGCFLVLVLVCGSGLRAQLSFSQTYGVPHSVDGESLPVFFNFSADFAPAGASVAHTQLSIDFGKAADLVDDPPFYSDIGFLLRKLDGAFSVVSEVMLLNPGGFNDGAPSAFFDGEITFDDNAPTLVNSDPDQPASGFFRPIEALSLLNGSYSPFWELRLVDSISGSPLLFHSATLTTTLNTPIPAPLAAVPEPASIGLGGACLLGFVILRRRSRASV